MEVDWEQSVFSLKIHEEECKKSKYAMVSMICEWRWCESLVVQGSEDEGKKRLQWFHVTFWMPRTLVTE